MTTADVEQFKSLYQQVFKQITSLDEVLDSATDQKTAGKRARINALVKEYEEVWTQYGSEILSKFEGENEDFVAGVYNGLTKMLKDKLADDINTYIEGLVEATPASEIPVVSPEELETAQKQRSEFYKQGKMIRDLAFMLGGSEDDFPPLKKRTGARGVRGPRAISLFDWSVDGVDLSGDKEKNTLLWVAKEHGYEKSAALRAAMKEAGINTSEPPDTITFTLKDNAVLVGTKRVSASDEEPDENEEDEDDDDDDDE